MDLVTLGELLIDMFPAETGKHLAEVSAFMPKPGGSVANMIVAAARLGMSTAFLGKVGQDFFGEFLRDVLAREGVETRGVRFDTEARTTLALIAQPGADNEYIFYRNPGADQRLRPDELDRELLAQTRAFHFASLSLTDEPSRSATFEALRLAKQHDALISFDVNYRPTLWRSRDEAVAQTTNAVPYADVLKMNETELELATGMTDVERGTAEMLARGPKLVVITLGAEGSFYRTAKQSGSVPGFRVEAIDSTGCGDAFVGALLAQLIPDGVQGLDAHLPGALEFANAAGAITATRRGGIPALPTLVEVREFMEQALPKTKR